MNKAELFKAMWIPIGKRRPPDSEEGHILIKIKTPEGKILYSVTTAQILNTQINQREGKNGAKMPSNVPAFSGYYAIEWMKIIP